MSAARILELRGLSKTFAGHVPALHAVDLVQREGEFLAVMGPSGYGNSTLLNIVAGFDQKALFPAERSVVMTPRPARIVLDLRIDLPRPRDVTSKPFNDYKREIADVIHPAMSLGAAAQ